MVAMSKLPTVTILGTGYAGLSAAALLASAGIKTYVIDKNEERLASVAQGKSFFYEQGLDPLVADSVAKKMLVPTNSYAEAVPNSQVVISAVGTPDNPDGSSNLTYIFAAATEAAKYMRPGTVFAQKSTVPVGTGAKVKQLFAEANVSVAYISNPEFLRESTSVPDMLWPDRTVLGGDDPKAIEQVRQLYQQIESQCDAIAALAGITPPATIPVNEHVTVGLESAELIKVVSNTFLALKISFANSIALLSDRVGADITEVMDAVGADRRIGRAFLQAGRGYGGGCIPKDVSGLLASARDTGVDLNVIRETQLLNESMPAYILEKMQDKLDGSLAGKTVAVLGLSFKPNTSDVRRSFGVHFANDLIKLGAHARVFDPEANSEAKKVLHPEIVVAQNADEAISQADAVVIATDWPEFVERAPQSYAEALTGTVFVDAMNRFEIQAVADAGLQYIGVGRG